MVLTGLTCDETSGNSSFLLVVRGGSRGGGVRAASPRQQVWSDPLNPGASVHARDHTTRKVSARKSKNKVNLVLTWKFHQTLYFLSLGLTEMLGLSLEFFPCCLRTI